MVKSAANEVVIAAHSINDRNRQSEALAIAAAALAKAEQFDEAIIAAHDIKNVFLKGQSLKIIAEMLVKANRLEEAEVTAGQAIAAAGSIGDEYTMALALKLKTESLIKTVPLNDDLLIARSFSDKSLRAGSLEAIAIAIAIARTGQPEAAKAITAEAIASADGVEIAFYRAETLTKVAEALANAGEFNGAITVARNIDIAFHRTAALAAVAKAFAIANKFVEAKAYVDEGLQNISSLSRENKSKAYSIFAEVYAKLRDYKTARSKAELCTNSEDRIAAYTIILQEYAIHEAGVDPKLFKDASKEND